MSFGKVAYCLLIISIALASGMPQDRVGTPQDTAESPPFLQFTNGGVRVNFAGYHAEAGLGGLLRGLGGGLHASAGTPWGAHAGAGLGGQVGGEDGSLGGGLYARAGLGPGNPEAAAGLGGRLDGRSATPISGGMYAGASPGGEGTGVFLGGGLRRHPGERDVIAPFIEPFVSEPFNPAVVARKDSADAGTSADAGGDASADAAASGTKPSKGHTNIQIIPSRKEARKRKEKVAAVLPVDTPADNETKSQDKEIRRAVVIAAVPPAPLAPPLAEADLVKSIYLGTGPIIKSVDKSVVVVPAAVAPTPVAVQINASTNKTATVANNPNVVVSKPVPARWYLRRRIWNPPRKVFYASAAPAAADSQSASSDMAGGFFINGGVAAEKAYTGGSFFDDIFNIPISTLSAVNQLLRNNVG